MGQNLCKEETRVKQEQSQKIGDFYYLKGEKFEHTDKKIAEEDIQQKIQVLIDELAADQVMFKDPDFKTMQFSLKAPSGKIVNVKWLRTNAIVKGQMKIFTNQTNAELITVKDDIMSYFGVFLIFLARHPALISKLILTKANTFGLHCVKSLSADRGFVVIDDLIACESPSNVPLFTQPEKNSVWPLLIEKAWMKINGKDIFGIHNLSPQLPLEEFLLVPTQDYAINDKSEGEVVLEKFKNFLKSPESVDYFYHLKTKKFNLSNDQLIGLKDQCFYAILTSFQCNDQTFFLLRSPMGSFNYRGKWTVPDAAQLRALKEQEYLDIRPGNFIIDEQQFVTFFDTLQVVFYRAHYQSTVRKFYYNSNEEIYFSFKLKNKGLIGISILQKYDQKSAFMMELVDITRNQQVSHGEKKSYAPASTTRMFDEGLRELEAGSYLIRLKAKDKAQGKQKEARLVVYAHQSQKIEFDIKQQDLYKNKFKDYLLAVGQKIFESGKDIIKNQHFYYSIKWFVDENAVANRAVIYIQRKSRKNKQIEIEYEFPELKNLECLTHVITSERGYSGMITVKEGTQMMIFEKRYLHQETSIGAYSLGTE